MEFHFMYMVALVTIIAQEKISMFYVSANSLHHDKIFFVYSTTHIYITYSTVR